MNGADTARQRQFSRCRRGACFQPSLAAGKQYAESNGEVERRRILTFEGRRQIDEQFPGLSGLR